MEIKFRLTSILITTLLTGVCFVIPIQTKASCNEEAYTTAEMRECAEQATQSFQVKMNYYYSEAFKMFKGNKLVLEELKSSQNLWEEYSKAQCGAEWEMHRDASIRGLIWEECMTSMTRQRTYRIWSAYFKDVYEGDHLLPDPR